MLKDTVAMLTNECCPQCGVEVDSGRVRLVQDSCGHRKCRECLHNDETGCKQCPVPDPVPVPVYIELRPIHHPEPDGEPSPESHTDVLTPLTNVTEVVSVTDPLACSISLDLSKSKCETEQVSLPNLGDTQTEEFPQDVEKRDPREVKDSHDNRNKTGKAVPLKKKPPTFGLKEHIVFTPGNPSKYTCRRCEKSYNNRKAARYHNYCGALNTEKPHICIICGQGYVTTSHLAYHMKSHTGSLPFTCNSCGKGFKQKSKLNRHSKCHEETAKKPFKCDMCEKAFCSKQILNEHVLSHSANNFVTCTICNKKLSSQSCLRKHKKLHADLLHKCKDCGKKFSVKWSLDVHMRSHQRERKFKCKECPRAFKIHSDLKRHATVHKDDGEWECKNCHLTFRRRDNLVRHLKNIHPESSLAVPSKLGNDKDVKDEKEERKEELIARSTTSISQAVSVIRAVPVIQKVESATTYSQSTICVAGIMDQSTRWHSQNDTLINSVEPPVETNQTNYCIDQNIHRESVVQYGSSSLETNCDMNCTRTRTNESLSNNVQSADPSGGDNGDFVLQNNAVPVIVGCDNKK